MCYENGLFLDTPACVLSIDDTYSSRLRCMAVGPLFRYVLGGGVLFYLGFWLLEKYFIRLFSSSTRVLEGLQPMWMWAVTAVFQRVCFIYLNARHTAVGRYALAWKVNGLRLLLSLEEVGLAHL